VSDVSCRAYTYFQAAERAGLVDLDVLLEGCALERAVLEDSTKRVPWDDWAALCDRFVELTGEAALESSGDLMIASELGGALARLNAAILRPSSLYRIAQSVGPMLYRTVHITTEDVGAGRVRMMVEIPAPHRPSLGWLQMASHVLPALPRYLGLPDAVMVLESMDDRHFSCVLTPPRSRTVLDRLRAVWTGMFRTDWVLEELDFHQSQLTGTHEALKRSEQGFREALDALPAGVGIHRAGRLVYANPPLTRWVREEEEVGDLRSSVGPEGREALEGLLDGRTSGPEELAFGRDPLRWLQVTGIDLTFEGQPARMLFCVDITARRAAEAEAESGRQTLVRLSYAIPDLVMRVDGQGVLLDFIAGSDHYDVDVLKGLRGQDIVGIARTFAESMDPGFLGSALGALDAARATGKPATTHVRLRWRTDRRHMEVRVIPSEGELLLLIRDVTRRTQLEEQLAISERMASVGTLAAGVAHEINNPLTYVSANVQFVMDDLSRMAAGEAVDVATMQEALADALEGSDRVAEIVQELKGFSKVGVDDLKAVELSTVVASALRLADNELRHRAVVEHTFLAAPLARADPTKLVQVVVNLLINAAQAIEPGDVAGNRVHVRVDTDGEGWPMVTVEDSGCGMSDEVARRVFDPFFTTKGLAGTGLGMAICHRIITGLGGRIEVESQLDQGTQITVRLPPAAGGIAPELSAGEPLREVVPRRILVVDDDVPVGRAVARMLAPHHVRLATGAAEALAALNDEVPDLVLCDVMMPGMSGLELYRRLEERGLEGRVAFVSGGVFSEEARSFIAEYHVPFLLKPFQADELHRRVAELLVDGD